jgi:UDP-N-acetylmuramoylalanine--D-glutamate ligase
MDSLAIRHALQQNLEIAIDTSRILVVGLGKTGYSIARFLNQYDYKFAIADSRDKPPLMEDLLQKMPDTAVFTGGFDEAAFSVATHLIVSPGVALTEKAIQQAKSSGVKIISDIDLFACAICDPVIAITGSNGKSTVTTILGKMAANAGIKVAVGGNLGTPALDLIAADAKLYILELSSFQLERTTQLKPVAATVLNVSPDHMDRHLNFDDYAAQKRKVFRGNGVMVLNADDPVVADMREPGRKTLTFGLDTDADYQLRNIDNVDWLSSGQTNFMPVKELLMVGRHNVANALAALALGEAVGLPATARCQALRSFTGLQHRMQRVAEINGVTWINDSKATNIGACIAALQGQKKKVILIAGGDCKGADMHELVPVIKNKTKTVVLMGKDAGLIEQALNGCIPVHFASTVQQAVRIAAQLAQAGESVLLSPACASLDQFSNYQERGEKFVEAVWSLAA